MRIGTTELMVILVVVLIIFGPKQLPKLGKMFGKTMKSFKEGVNTEEEDGEDKVDADAEKPAEEKKTEDKAE